MGVRVLFSPVDVFLILGKWFFLRFSFLIGKMVIILLPQLSTWEVDLGLGISVQEVCEGVSLRPTSAERRAKYADWAQGHANL